MSYYQMAQEGYKQLVNAIIRPPRCRYDAANLGPARFELCGRVFSRRDFELRNARGLTLVCSMWEPVVRANLLMPCVIYMHGNSSARVEAIPQLSTVLGIGASLLSLDFRCQNLMQLSPDL